MNILETDRLLLRWFTADDAPFILTLLNEPSWIRNIGDRGVRTLDDAKSWIEDRLVAGCRKHGFGFWAMVRREDGAVIGMAGLVQRESLPEVDVGYALLPAYWGHGYAIEAARACKDYGRRVLGLRRMLAITSQDNMPSRRVLEKMGFRFTQNLRLPGEDEDVALFAWEDEAPLEGDRDAIDALAARFFALFSNRDGAISNAPAIPWFFLPQAVISRAQGDATEVLDVQGFMAPRAELLSSGRLVDFSEHETEARTEVSGRIAERWSRYRKSGVLDGVAFTAQGTKAMQLVRTKLGWKIAALAFQDDE